MMLTDEFCNDSNSNNKINNINNNNNIRPKGTYTQRACFFSISTKKSTEWYYIQPTINTVYHISYCLRGCMWGCVCKPFFSQFAFFFPVCGFFHVATLNESLPVFTGWGEGWLRAFQTQSWAPHVSTSSCSSSSSPFPWCRRLRGFFCSLSSFRSLALRAPSSGSPNCQ